jgi:hypothetical protein
MSFHAYRTELALRKDPAELAEAIRIADGKQRTLNMTGMP